ISNCKGRSVVLSGQFTGFTGNAFESPSFSGFKLVDGVQAETIEATTVTSKVTRSKEVTGPLMPIKWLRDIQQQTPKYFFELLFPML
ncbi:hypothetical protein V1478_016557, partial [Vespula squamosa]